MRSNTSSISFYCCVLSLLLFFKTVRMAIVGEYYFNNSAYSSGFQNLGVYMTPVIKLASEAGNDSEHNPTLTAQGAYIENQTF